jgi:hypothetical protein
LSSMSTPQEKGPRPLFLPSSNPPKCPQFRPQPPPPRSTSLSFFGGEEIYSRFVWQCSFETLDSPCLRCRLRNLECGPKLPPQQRPRSITSVPADYRRPLSLTIDTSRALNFSDDYDTPPGSAGSFDSAGLHSLPVSPFLMPLQGGTTAATAGRFDVSTTPLGGSPSPSLHLDRFDGVDAGYFPPLSHTHSFLYFSLLFFLIWEVDL